MEALVELIQYIASEADLIKAQTDNDIEQQRKKELVLNPESVEEKDFSYDLLNNIFIHRFGLSRQLKSMIIGGIEVEKLVFVYQSNSRKSSDSSVTFTWRSFDRQYHCIEKERIILSLFFSGTLITLYKMQIYIDISRKIDIMKIWKLY